MDKELNKKIKSTQKKLDRSRLKTETLENELKTLNDSVVKPEAESPKPKPKAKKTKKNQSKLNLEE